VAFKSIVRSAAARPAGLWHGRYAYPQDGAAAGDDDEMRRCRSTWRQRRQPAARNLIRCVTYDDFVAALHAGPRYESNDRDLHPE